MDVIERTIRLWQERGVGLNPPASTTDLDTLRDLFGREVPEDIRDFYHRANGMPENVYDQHEVSFWPISRIRQEYVNAPGDGLGFADFLVGSWRFLFVVDASGVTIVTENVAPGSPYRPIGSFSEFLKRYEASAGDLGVL
jgi:hypothetical protein